MNKQLLSASLILSDFGRKSFTDKDLSKYSNGNKEKLNLFLENNKETFDSINLKFDFCPNCKKMLLDTNKKFCGGCGKDFDDKEISSKRININKKGFVELSQKILTDGLIRKWKIKNTEANFILYNHGEVSIANFISLEETGLKDYYMLKGWLESNENAIFLIISKTFDKELGLIASKNPRLILLDFRDFFQKKDLIQSRINYSINNLKEEKDFEDKSGGKFEEELNIIELKERLNNTLSNLDDYALHKNKLSPQENGRRYQRAVIEILNQTILPIRVLIKQNIQDVLIRIPQTNIKKNSQIKWIPLEIKSFGINDKNNGKFSIRNYGSQYVKYIEGHVNDPYITSLINTKCFIILAKDFLIDNNNLEAIKTIEKKFDNNIHISLLPQDSLICLMNKKINQKSPIIDFNLISDLFRENLYITREKIEEFYKKIEDKFLESPEETALKLIQKNVHKQGK